MIVHVMSDSIVPKVIKYYKNVDSVETCNLYLSAFSLSEMNIGKSIQILSPAVSLLITSNICTVRSASVRRGFMRLATTMAPALIIGLCGLLSSSSIISLKSRPLGSDPRNLFTCEIYNILFVESAVAPNIHTVEIPQLY